MKASIAKPWNQFYGGLLEKTKPEYGSSFLAIWNQNKENLTQTATMYYGKNQTYGEFFQRVELIASALAQNGVKKGDVIHILMLNSPDAMALFYAANKLGAVVNSINGMYPLEKIVEFVNTISGEILITLNIFLEKIVKASSDFKDVKKVVVMNLTDDMGDEMPHMPKAPLPNADTYVYWDEFLNVDTIETETAENCDAPAAVLYTSGSMGGSKAVVLSSRNINSPSLLYMFGNPEVEKGGVALNTVPMSVVSGFSIMMQYFFYFSMTQLIRIPGSETVNDLLRFKPDVIMSYPDEYKKFDVSAKRDLSFIRQIISGADMLPKSVALKLNRYLEESGSSAKLLNGYGMTETAAPFTCTTEKAYNPASVGIPWITNVVAAFNPETGEECELNETGELCLQSDAIMLGYYNNQEETDKILRKHEDGSTWLHTGDLGYVDEDGFVYVTGRMKRIISVKADKGFYTNVASADVESIIRQHECVAEAFVVAMPAEEYSVPFAYIVLNDGYGTEDIAKLKSFVASSLPEYMQPKKYAVIDSIPSNAMKKIDFRKLESMIDEVETI